MITPGDKILGLSLAHGGHLTHGMKLNFSGKLYNVAAYQVEEDNFRVDMDKLREQAIAEKPQVIIAGWSAYPRHLDFAAFRSIATRWAHCSGPTWRTSPAWWPPACTRARCRTPTS
jgi:glycine hydroxymethyltransferase